MEAKLANLDGLAKLNEHARRHFSGPQQQPQDGAVSGGGSAAAATPAVHDGTHGSVAARGEGAGASGPEAASLQADDEDGAPSELGLGLGEEDADDIMNNSLPPQFRLRNDDSNYDHHL